MQSWSFVIGAMLFALGSAPRLSDWLGSLGANIAFFVGAWFFTAGAFQQLLLSGPATIKSASKVALRVVWLSAAVQLLGTLLFNVSTGAALHARTIPEERDFVWAPTAEGATAFLVSSALAVFVLIRAGQYWQPASRDWLSTWFNAFGSIGFGFSAAGAVITVDGAVFNASWVHGGTFIGALFFVAGSAIYLVPSKARSNSAAYSDREQGE